MAIYQHMAGVAEKLGKDLLEARDIARRAWMFSGAKAYTPELWDGLSEAEKQDAIQHENQTLERYDMAYRTLIANAPALLDKIGDAELFFETRLRLMSALEIEGIPYQPATPNQAAAAMETSEEDQEWEATIARMNPNELQCMESPLKQVERLMTRMPVTTSWQAEKTSILAPEKQALSQMCNVCFRAMAVCTCDDAKPKRQTRKMLIARATMKGILPQGHASYLDSDLYAALERRNWYWDTDSQRWIDTNSDHNDKGDAS